MSVHSIVTAPRPRIQRERPRKAADTTAGRVSASDRARLRGTPLLAALPPETFERLLAAIHIRSTGRDEMIFEQGAPATAIDILLDGRVALLGAMSDQRSCVLEVLGPRDGLLDPSALIRAAHPVSARAIESCRIASLPESDIRQVINAEEGLCRGAVILLTQQWRLFLHRLEDQKLRSAPQRLAAYLLECGSAAVKGPIDADAPMRFILAEDRRTLASHLGMTPENLSRVIAQLRKLGVELQGRAVTISDIDGLRHFGCTDAHP